MATKIQVGQIWRDTYFDKNPMHNGKRSERTVRVLATEHDRWLVQTITNADGSPKAGGRLSRVSSKTLRHGYVLVTMPREFSSRDGSPGSGSGIG